MGGNRKDQLKFSQNVDESSIQQSYSELFLKKWKPISKGRKFQTAKQDSRNLLTSLAKCKFPPVIKTLSAVASLLCRKQEERELLLFCCKEKRTRINTHTHAQKELGQFCTRFSKSKRYIWGKELMKRSPRERKYSGRLISAARTGLTRQSTGPFLSFPSTPFAPILSPPTPNYNRRL